MDIYAAALVYRDFHRENKHMPTVWFTSAANLEWTEAFEAAGWETMLTGSLPQSQARPCYPDVTIYQTPDGSLPDSFQQFCQMKITPILAVVTNWAVAWQAIVAGADDAIAMPVNSAELLFRAHRLAYTQNIVRIDELVIDLVARRVKRGAQIVCLSPVEL